MKKYIIGFVLGAVLAVSGSVFASLGGVITPVQKLPAIAGAKAPVVKLSPTEIRFRALELRVAKLEAKQK